MRLAGRQPTPATTDGHFPRRWCFVTDYSPPRTVAGLTIGQLVLDLLLAGIAAAIVYGVSADLRATVAAAVIGAVWFYAGVVYGWGEAMGI